MATILIVIMLVHIAKITNVIRITSVAHNVITSKVEKCHKDCKEAEWTAKLQNAIHSSPEASPDIVWNFVPIQRTN